MCVGSKGKGSVGGGLGAGPGVAGDEQAQDRDGRTKDRYGGNEDGTIQLDGWIKDISG